MTKAEHEDADRLCKIIDENNDANLETAARRYARAQLAIALLTVMADSLSIKLAEHDPNSPHLVLADRDDNRNRELAISNTKYIPPIFGIPEWPAEFVQFDVEAGPSDVFALQDLRVKPSYAFDKRAK